jgi:hypothetical protein
MSAPKGEINFAFLLLRSSKLPPVRTFFTYFAKHWPDLERPDKFDGEQEVVMFEGKSTRGFVGAMGFPIPDILPDESEKPALTTEKDRIAGQHKAHAIVAINSKNPKNPVERAVLLTRWVTSIGHACDALGVYWGAGEAICLRPAFEEQADLISKEYLPIPLWVSFSAFRGKSRAVILSTNGLNSLGMWEVEALSSRHQPGFLYPYVCGFACYVLTKGPVGNGHTFGYSEEERIPVRHIRKGWRKKVYRLDFDSAKM